MSMTQESGVVLPEVPPVYLEADVNESSLPSVSSLLDLLTADANTNSSFCLDDTDCLQVTMWLGIHPKRNDRSRLAVQKLLTHELPEVQAMACWASIQYNSISRPTVKAIAELLDSPFAEVREAACEALGAAPGEKVKRYLAALILLRSDSNPEVARMASWAAGRLGAQPVLSELRAAINADMPMQRFASPAQAGSLRQRICWLLWTISLRWMIPLGKLLFAGARPKAKKSARVKR